MKIIFLFLISTLCYIIPCVSQTNTGGNNVNDIFAFPSKNTCNCNPERDSSLLTLKVELQKNVANAPLGDMIGNLEMTASIVSKMLYSQNLATKIVTNTSRLKQDTKKGILGMLSKFDSSIKQIIENSLENNISVKNEVITEIIYNNKGQVIKIKAPADISIIENIEERAIAGNLNIDIYYDEFGRIIKTLKKMNEVISENNVPRIISTLTSATVEYLSNSLFRCTSVITDSTTSKQEKSIAEFVFDKRLNLKKEIFSKRNASGKLVKHTESVFNYYEDYGSPLAYNLNYYFAMALLSDGSGGGLSMSTNFIKKIIKRDLIKNNSTTSVFNVLLVDAKCCMLKFEKIEENTDASAKLVQSYKYPALENVPLKPLVTTANASQVTTNAAVLGGTVTNDGGAPIFERGVCYGTINNPTISNAVVAGGVGKGFFVTKLSALSPNTIYYIKAYAINCKGIAYGNQISFVTQNGNPGGGGGGGGNNPSCATVKDIDNNIYCTVKIGNQVWMKENLRTTHFRDGSPIPNISDKSLWKYLSNSAWCDSNNNATYGNLYGHLYNWYAATDARNIAPAGWHLPTEADWNTLITYLGGYNVAGKSLKATTSWNAGDTSTNSSGFSALSAVKLNAIAAIFEGSGSLASFWSSGTNPADSSVAWMRQLVAGDKRVKKLTLKKTDGIALRCVKD